MRKKCVQLMQRSRITLWVTRFCAQRTDQITRRVGKFSVHAKLVPALFHRLFTQINPRCNADLYPFSTIPTITTICLKNKDHNNNVSG